ncbi:DUF2085 domain-containing protein [Chryseobacterium sp. Leaf201]|uniref:DUF2085 domain-containing protein n=1 Tax=Chryseobacterium sp. Leaf201 TaxID=1735672 RepID=UPI0006FF7895|nr:DUF2085 domain-containing protein [Chryseobacterium sp. Leaf201]KQM23499.1 hypothetical protein ASE55_05845 [Chryseobacterium sp. Leaf201]
MTKIQWVDCHRMPSRSFFYKKKQFPVCARCTGIYLGYFLMIPMLWFYQIGMFLSVLLILPTLIDGLTQAYLNRESTNVIRCITGFLAGIGISGFSERITYYTYKFIETLIS